MVFNSSPSVPGRWCAMNGMAEESALLPAMDFRQPQYRREVFLRAYEFHLKYGTMPGCVYFLMPWLAKFALTTIEDKLWFAFINGNTQNPVTSWLIYREFSSFHSLSHASLTAWFNEHYAKLEFDTDRRYHKKNFLQSVLSYMSLIGAGTQEQFFYSITHNEKENFRRLWARQRDFYSFGRLSMFSYLEYLRIMGVPVECDQLFLDDLDGSKSHRNGLCKVLGRDDLDWHDSNPAFPGYSKEVLGWLKEEGEALLGEARHRLAGEPYARDIGYFTLESQLCNFKSWFRPNRRYPNVYADMLVGRIRRAEEHWKTAVDLFWGVRRECLPDVLRLEDQPWDGGVVPEKQNLFRTTGQVVMMDLDWDCFTNDYFQRCRGKVLL